MDESLLITKLHAPPLRSEYVQRKRLYAALDGGLTRKLTLISAPAGSGKTTLVSGWAHQQSIPVTWLSLDIDDNDVFRFLTYMITALQNAQSTIGLTSLGMLQTVQINQIEEILIQLTNEVLACQTPVILILDDYHLITSQEVHDVLLFLIDHISSQLHILITTREDPPFPLSRLRGRGELVELRTADLRFTNEEAALFIKRTTDSELTLDQVIALTARTEGWIVGLQLAAHSIRDQTSSYVNNFIETFTGSHRYILDYLIEEVLLRQTPEVQDFLLHTSILERFTPSLCDALTGRKDGHLLVKQLDAANLFIIPLDQAREWYRYHHLFADLLRIRLEQTVEQDQIALLHRRASDWFEEHGFITEAIDHSLKTNEVTRIAGLVERHVLAILEQGHSGTLMRWLKSMTPEMIMRYPWLNIARAWMLARNNSFEEALSFLSEVDEQLIQCDELSPDQVKHINGHIKAIHCYIEVYSMGNRQRSIQLANEALDLLPQADMRTRGMILVLLGNLYRLELSFSLSTQTLKRALVIYRESNQNYVVIDILAQLARIHRDQGRLHDAVKLYKEAHEIGTYTVVGKPYQSPLLAKIMGTSGRIYYEWNRLDDALQIGQQAVAFSKQLGQAHVEMGAHLLMAKILTRRRQNREALNSIQEALACGPSSASPIHEFIIGTAETDIRLAMGDIDSVERWVIKNGRRDDIATDVRDFELAHLNIVLFRNHRIHDLKDLLSFLTRYQSHYEERMALNLWVKVLILRALSLFAMSEVDQGLEVLSRALKYTESESYIRSYIDHGSAIAELLNYALARGISTNYVRKLLETLSSDHPDTEKQSNLIDPLSDREMEVLRLLTTHLTQSEIAVQLYISINTLRTHTKNIYDKLNVHNRTEAVNQAQKLNLL